MLTAPVAVTTCSRHTVHLDRIRAHWDDMLRVAGSLTSGKVRAYDLIRRLSRDGGPTGLGDAFAHYGRIFKPLHLLQFISDDGYSRVVRKQLLSLFFIYRPRCQRPVRNSPPAARWGAGIWPSLVTVCGSSLACIWGKFVKVADASLPMWLRLGAKIDSLPTAFGVSSSNWIGMTAYAQVLPR